MTPEPNAEQARAWDQGWKTAVAWMRSQEASWSGRACDLPANPYLRIPSGVHTCSCGCGNPVGDS